MNMENVNDGCCARKKGVYYMFASAVAHGSHPYEEDIIKEKC
jgi:hypothetical protein